MADEIPPYHPRCKYLCCKSMMVFGEAFQTDPEYQAGMVDFWCVQTSKGTGPDGDSVTLACCSNQERSCFEEY
jgi:hypothetical protein